MLADTNTIRTFNDQLDYSIGELQAIRDKMTCADPDMVVWLKNEIQSALLRVSIEIDDVRTGIRHLEGTE